jgi:hypothetical protein
MRRTIVASLLIAAIVVSIASGAGGGSLRLTIKPRVGHPGTSFVVAFTAPRAGRYEAVARSACRQRVKGGPKSARKGVRVRVALAPPGKEWCIGTVRAEVRDLQTRKRLARFSFSVAAAGTDTAPPSFAGLKSAVQCFPGPMTPGEERPVGLSWTAATDAVSPSSQITYDIYMASTAGGENFSQPSWTTQGATSFTTPSLPAGRFFVVRARDTAGNEDHNTVERRAENPCL